MLTIIIDEASLIKAILLAGISRALHAVVELGLKARALLKTVHVVLLFGDASDLALGLVLVLDDLLDATQMDNLAVRIARTALVELFLWILVRVIIHQLDPWLVVAIFAVMGSQIEDAVVLFLGAHVLKPASRVAPLLPNVELFKLLITNGCSLRRSNMVLAPEVLQWELSLSLALGDMHMEVLVNHLTSLLGLPLTEQVLLILHDWH